MALLLLVNVQFHEASRVLHEEDGEKGEETSQYIEEGNIFLQSLQKGSMRPPRNGCAYTPNGGGPPCINHKNFAEHMLPPLSAYPAPVIRFGVTSDSRCLIEGQEQKLY
ncbi:hypothetical protein BT93_H1440 [Corymbia citriodora subsp. variegata]|nr:hypothetical protein BT93_H1440 [Corymbia citriodora subsp. variegata]